MWKDEPTVKNWLEVLAENVQHARVQPDAPVVELGSYAMHDHNPRPLFPGRPYVGLDARPGPGVDRAWCSGINEVPDDLHNKAALVLSISALEHDPYWKDTLGAMVALVAPGGLLGLTYPLDPWMPHEVECAPKGGTYYANPTNTRVLACLTGYFEADGKKIDAVLLNGDQRTCAPHWPRAMLVVFTGRDDY